MGIFVSIEHSLCNVLQGFSRPSGDVLQTPKGWCLCWPWLVPLPKVSVSLLPRPLSEHLHCLCERQQICQSSAGTIAEKSSDLINHLNLLVVYPVYHPLCCSSEG